MSERLGRALSEGGATAPPSRVEWVALASHTVLQK